MKFDELDERMRVFETAHDHCVLPGLFMVARLDGRSFTRLTKETHSFEAPFDVRFRDLMVATVEHLMNGCGFNVLYGFTESDEISLLFSRDADSFHRKTRKLISILAGEASAAFSLLLAQQAVFDCRISQLPDIEHVVDYFRWRNEDAHRNALSAHSYWCLRKEGKSAERQRRRWTAYRLPTRTSCFFSTGSTSMTCRFGKSEASVCIGRSTTNLPRIRRRASKSWRVAGDCAGNSNCP